MPCKYIELDRSNLGNLKKTDFEENKQNDIKAADFRETVFLLLYQISKKNQYNMVLALQQNVKVTLNLVVNW